MTRKLLVATLLLGISGTVIAATTDVRSSAPPACRVEGVWERVATIQARKTTEFSGARQRKMVTKRNYMWLEEEAHRDTLPLRTAADTARFYAMSGGSGTYQVAGNKYTEHLDLFVDPKFEGKTFTASCRVEGNTWYHSFLASTLGDTTRAGRDTTTEVWRRVE
jgi:hypothetical protein